MFVLMLIIHILVCFALMAVVLMQSGKGRGLAGAFGGGGGNQTVFGGRGAVDFLGKATWILGGAFMVTSLVLAILSGSNSQRTSVQESLIKKSAATAPAVPGGSAPASAPASAPQGSEPGSAPASQQAPAPVTPAPAAGGGGH
jgi:preprotein translocase subunit SecG